MWMRNQTVTWSVSSRTPHSSTRRSTTWKAIVAASSESTGGVSIMPITGRLTYSHVLLGETIETVAGVPDRPQHRSDGPGG